MEEKWVVWRDFRLAKEITTPTAQPRWLLALGREARGDLKRAILVPGSSPMGQLMKPPRSQSPLAPQTPPHCEEAVAFRREMGGAGELATFSNTEREAGQQRSHLGAQVSFEQMEGPALYLLCRARRLALNALCPTDGDWHTRSQTQPIGRELGDSPRWLQARGCGCRGRETQALRRLLS